MRIAGGQPMVLGLLLVLVLLAASAFFSGSETALFALKRHELHRFQQDKRASRRLVAALMRHPRQLLLTLMIANVTVNFFIYAASLSVSEKIVGRQSAWAPLLGLASPLLITLLGEIVPKGAAISFRQEFAVRVAPFVRVCRLVLSPVTFLLGVFLVEPTTRLLTGNHRARAEVNVEELRELVEMSERRKIIGADENAMLSGAIRLNDLKVRDIMVPRVDIVAFDIHDNPHDLRTIMREKRLSKVPVYDETIDRPVGLVYAKDLFLNPTFQLQELVKPIRFIPELVTLTQLLRHFRATRTALALAVDEYGGVVGLVTVEDVAEEIVGELADSSEAEGEPAWERLDERRYRVSGGLNVRDWAEVFGVDRFDDRVTTLAGLVVSHLGRLPAVGDEFTLANIRFTVESLRGRRIEWLRLELLETPVAGENLAESRRKEDA